MELEEELSPTSAAVVQLLLKEDLLFHLFEYFTFCDRRNVKLVCKKWYRVCSLKKFVDKEALYFPHFYDMPSILKVLTDFHRPKLNIKFSCRQLYRDIDSLLYNCADRIESLQFYDCIFDYGTLTSILKNCINLKELGLFGNCDLWPREFLKPNVQHEKLTTLHLCCSNVTLYEHILSFIVFTFPKLKSLEWITAVNKDQVKTALFIFNFLAKRSPDIETLHVRCNDAVITGTSSEFDPVYNQLSQIDLSRLKNIGMPLLFEREIPNKISLRQSLTCAEIAAENFAVDMSLLADFLVEYINLEDLKFVCPLSDYTADFCLLFIALVKSRLKSLKILFTVDLAIEEQFSTVLSDIFTEVAGLMKTVSSNLTLRYLALNVAGFTEINNLFFKYFSNIRELELDFPVPDIDISLENQVNFTGVNEAQGMLPLRTSNALKTLVESLEFITIRSPTAFWTHRFPNLKCLFIIEEFKFSNTYNTLDSIIDHRIISEIFIQRFNEILSVACEGSPKLEAVEYRCETIELAMDALLSFFECCLNFPNLRYVILSFRMIVGEFDQLKREIFDYCKQYVSIQCIWLLNGRAQHIFYLDKITQKFQYKLIEDSYKSTDKYELRLKKLCSY